MIVLLSHSLDHFTIDRVMEHLSKLGAEFVRLNTDALPFFQPVSSRFGTGEPSQVVIEFENGPHGLATDSVTAVWNRRLWAGRMPEDFPPEAAARCLPAAQTAVQDMLGLFTNARWMNGLEQGRRAESKIHQLQLAERLGLRLPPTLVSNNPRDVEAFYYQHQGEIITKLLVPTVVSMEGHPDFAYTCRVEPHHLEQLEHVRAQPQIFQSFLPKQREFRAVCVGGKFLTGAIRVPQEGPLSVDWRQATDDDGLAWERADLPTDVEQRLLQMMEAFDLRFGVFDLIDTGEGEPYFLEVNQAGEWGMLERDLDLPISEAIARELAG